MSHSNYSHECSRLQQFLRRLPEADKHRELPIKMPKPPTEYRQPTFTSEEIESIIWSCVLDKVHPDLVIRLLIASVYGARAGELVSLRPEDIHIDDDNGTLYIRTLKGGQRKSQPIPNSLIPLFRVPFDSISDSNLRFKFKRLCRKIGIKLPQWGGFHSFRRRVATDLYEITGSELNVSRFMRWSAPRAYSMLSRYRQTPTEVTDTAVLKVHPYVAMWEECLPYIFKYNPHYNSLRDIV